MDKTTYILKINGILLTKARIRAGLSMDDLVKLMGDECRNKSSISRWERGEMTKVPLHRIEKLAEILGTRTFIVKKSNTADAVEKRNKLIVKLYAGGEGYTLPVLAVMFRMEESTVSKIITKRKEGKDNGE